MFNKIFYFKKKMQNELSEIVEKNQIGKLRTYFSRNPMATEYKEAIYAIEFPYLFKKIFVCDLICFLFLIFLF